MCKQIALITILVILGIASLADAADRKVIVGFRKESVSTDDDKRNRIYRSGGHVKRSHKMINAVSGRLPEEEIEKLKKDLDIAYVEADTVVGITDPAALSPALTQEYADSWGVTRIGGDAAVAAGITGAGIKVAMLDSGIDYNHPDLKDNYKGGYNFVYENNDPFDDGYNGHGTHIAGIIGARNNGTGVAGVAPEVSLYAVKVLGGMVMGDLSDILAGMEWAISNTMNIINLSIGAPIDSSAFRDACDRAYQAGIIVVAAAGNTNSNFIEFPAAYDSVIAVAATDQNDACAIFSNYGPKLELAAPGVNINSTMRGGGYSIMNGTSQATAHVSGAAALLLAKRMNDVNASGQVVDEIREVLGSSSTDLGDPGRDHYFGFGLVNLVKAISPPPSSQWKYTITRTPSSPRSQALTVPLKEGSYTVEVTFNGMHELEIIARDKSGLRKMELEQKPRHRAHSKRINEPVQSALTITIGASGSLVFIPEGRPGSSTDIVITRNRHEDTQEIYQ